MQLNHEFYFSPLQTEKALEQKERKNSGHPKETSDVKSENEGKELKHKDAVLKIEGVEIEGLSIDDVKATFAGLPIIRWFA